jgi:TDG/mug DNA glycosylase family protein
VRHRLADLDPGRVPAALAELHVSLPVGAKATLELPVALGLERAFDAVEGGGFDEIAAATGAPRAAGAEGATEGADALVVEAVRAQTLPDQVAPGLRLLVCGLNPSLYAADRGVGFARPGNRFWPAALAARVASRDRDPRWLRDVDRVGMTDLVKRATRAADELGADEYRRGAARLERLVRWLRPGATCFVGLSGWRAAVERRATAGPLPDGFAGRPAYLMPNTSGLNAHARLDDLAAHLRAALALGGTGPTGPDGWDGWDSWDGTAKPNEASGAGGEAPGAFTPPDGPGGARATGR